MSCTRALSIMIAAAMLTACGVGDDSAPPDEGATDSSSADAVSGTTTVPAATTTDPVATTSGTAAPTVASLASTTTTIVIDVTDAEPWRVDLTEPVGTILDAWVDQAMIAPIPTEPPDGLEAQLTWVYEDLIELWRGNLHLAALGMNETALDRPHRETSPGAMTDLMGAAGSILRDSYAVIAADAELAAQLGTPAEPMFAAWSEYAQRWVAAAELVRLALAEAHDLDAGEQACFLSTIDGDDDCEGPAAESADTLMIDFDDRLQAINDVEIDEIGWYAFTLEFDECRAWAAAVAATGLTPDQELRIWIALDDNYLDGYFASFGECGLEDDGEEDPQPDDEADEATFLAYLTTVAEAIVNSGYDETVYDFGSGAEDERRHFQFTSAQATQEILTAARDTASQLWTQAYATELATKLYVVAGIEIVDWTQLDDRELDWEDLGIPVCDGWTKAIQDYSEDQLTAIEAAVGELGLAGTLVPEACE